MAIGRPRGSLNKLTLKAIAIAEEKGAHPLEFLLDTMMDVKKDDTLRVDCAKASLPYLVPRLNSIDLRALVDTQPRTTTEINEALERTLESLAQSQRSRGLLIDHESVRPSNQQANDGVEGQRDLIGAVPVSERGREHHG